MYEDAIDAFREAQKIDPGFAMAYWGEAMSFSQPLWFFEEVDKGKTALAKLGATPAARLAKAKTPREQGFLRAAEALFGTGDKVARLTAHAREMARVAADNPADDDAQTFYALALLATLPESPDRFQRQLALQVGLGELLRATQGLAAPEVGDAYTRAYTLCQLVGETPQLAQILWGLSQFHMTQGRLATADELAQQLFDLVQRQPDTGFSVEGHFVRGTIASYRGELLASRAHLEQSWRLSGIVPSLPATLRGGFVPGVTLRTSLARVLWALGYADQAQQRCHEALALAQQGEHLPSVAYAECFVGFVCQCRRDVVATQAHADALIALAAAHSLPLRAEQGRIFRGWALAMHGEAVAGVDLLRQGLASPAVGPEILRPHWLALLAEACSRAGQPEAGLQVLAEAVTLMARTEMRWSEAEISRLQGELRLQLASPEVLQAEACFQQALEVARRQEAKSLELRAALSLSRLWQQQGQRQEARDLLAPIYAWFTEGFDTADLQEAKALLDELS